MRYFCLLLLFGLQDKIFIYYIVLHCKMETICIRLDKKTVKHMESIMAKNNFSTKTDFVREAIRDKVKKLDENEAMRNLNKYFGAGAHHKTTDEEMELIKEKVAQKYLKKFNLD